MKIQKRRADPSGACRWRVQFRFHEKLVFAKPIRQNHVSRKAPDEYQEQPVCRHEEAF